MLKKIILRFFISKKHNNFIYYHLINFNYLLSLLNKINPFFNPLRVFLILQSDSIDNNRQFIFSHHQTINDYLKIKIHYHHLE